MARTTENIDENDYRYDDSDDESITSIIEEQKNNLANLQLARFIAFKAQDTEKGYFDITFDLSGSLLHAHKFMISSVSTTMEAMISERWTNNNDAIKIETYNYDEFFHFLTFIYSGACEITVENAFRLVDIAEFFDVEIIKDSCDKYLSKSIKNLAIETIVETMEMVERYSLSKSIVAFKKLIRRNFQEIITSDVFLKFKRSSLDVLLSVKNISDNDQQLFLSIYNWAEKNTQIEDNSNLQDAIKKQLSGILPKINFKNMQLNFIVECVVDKKFLFTPKEFYKIIVESKRTDGEENKLLELLYQLAEKEAQTKSSSGEVVDISTAIKIELAECLPKIKFRKMKQTFLIDFAAKTRFFSHEEAIRCSYVNVQIKNGEKLLCGEFEDNLRIANHFRRYRSNDSGWTYHCKTQSNNGTFLFLGLRFKIPNSSSLVQQNPGVKWFLILVENGTLAVKLHSHVKHGDYLITALSADENFSFDYNQNICITVSHNKIF